MKITPQQLVNQATAYLCKGCGAVAVNSGDFPYCSWTCKQEHFQRILAETKK